MTSVSHLIDEFIPASYDLSLDLRREERTFGGSVTIKGESVNGEIMLHAKGLSIGEVTVDGMPAAWEAGDDDAISLITTTKKPGEHTITLSFSGTITDSMHGLYPCYYEHDGIKKELLGTQFESHYAREVFPCVDEPAAKATFDLTLVSETGVTVLSNMPVALQQESAGRLTTTFDTTPRMSTYLLAFVVGELQRTTAVTNGGVEVNIYSTPAYPADNLDFALTVATRTTDFYEEYFGVPYPLPKSDHVALPDFSAGAMENWGLITYRETALLADPHTTGVAAKRLVAHVIAHELAHQWFGNLVTMRWWNDLWLNESFATLMSYVSLDTLYPEWNMWLAFALDEDGPALRRDAIDGVQSIQVEVKHPDEIGTLFDPAIVYAKGARLMRMVQYFVGDGAFRTGLKAYFTTYAYANTVGNDLWRALSDASGKQIETMMNTWISQPGYPVVAVTHTAGDVTLEQSRFFVGPHEPSSAIWPIPLDPDDPAALTMLQQPSASFASDIVPLFNSSDSAHFITRYDEASYGELLRRVADGSLPVLNRVQLINEASLLALGGVSSSASLLTLLAAFTDESSEPVWSVIADALTQVRTIAETDPAAEKNLRTLSDSLASAQYERLGWDKKPDESEDDTKLRATIIAMMLYGEQTDAIETARTLYDQSPLDGLDPELRPSIIASVVRHGDDSVVDQLIDIYRDTHSGDIRQAIALGITQTRSEAKIRELLDLPLTKTVKPQDVRRWFRYLMQNPDARELAWQWLQDNWSWIDDTFGGDMTYDDYPRIAAAYLANDEQLKRYEAFFAPKRSIPALTRVIDMGLIEIRGRVDLIERDINAVVNTLLKLNVK